MIDIVNVEENVVAYIIDIYTALRRGKGRNQWWSNINNLKGILVWMRIMCCTILLLWLCTVIRTKRWYWSPKRLTMILVVKNNMSFKKWRISGYCIVYTGQQWSQKLQGLRKNYNLKMILEEYVSTALHFKYRTMSDNVFCTPVLT